LAVNPAQSSPDGAQGTQGAKPPPEPPPPPLEGGDKLQPGEGLDGAFGELYSQAGDIAKKAGDQLNQQNRLIRDNIRTLNLGAMGEADSNVVRTRSDSSRADQAQQDRSQGQDADKQLRDSFQRSQNSQDTSAAHSARSDLAKLLQNRRAGAHEKAGRKSSEKEAARDAAKNFGSRKSGESNQAMARRLATQSSKGDQTLADEALKNLSKNNSGNNSLKNAKVQQGLKKLMLLQQRMKRLQQQKQKLLKENPDADVKDFDSQMESLQKTMGQLEKGLQKEGVDASLIKDAKAEVEKEEDGPEEKDSVDQQSSADDKGLNKDEVVNRTGAQQDQGQEGGTQQDSSDQSQSLVATQSLGSAVQVYESKTVGVISTGGTKSPDNVPDYRAAQGLLQLTKMGLGAQLAANPDAPVNLAQFAPGGQHSLDSVSFNPGSKKGSQDDDPIQYGNLEQGGTASMDIKRKGKQGTFKTNKYQLDAALTRTLAANPNAKKIEFRGEEFDVSYARSKVHAATGIRDIKLMRLHQSAPGEYHAGMIA